MDDDEYVWVEGPFKNNPPALNHKLKSFEEDALRCPSCREFYTNAVTLRPCHHTFCSQCIRRSLATRNGVKDKQCCPICRTNLEIITPSGIKKQLKEEDAIIPNYGLQVSRIVAEGSDQNIVVACERRDAERLIAFTRGNDTEHWASDVHSFFLLNSF